MWYQPLPSSSAEVPQIFTDIHGVTHGNTVQQGLIRPEMWERQLSRSLGDMPPHLADMISSTPRPFVTKVGEVAVDGGPTFWDGRAVLVGDAFNSTRTHLGRASEQAARHCVNLDKVMAGDMTLDEYDRQAVLYARRLVLLNRIVGFTGLNWWGEWIGAVVAYMWLMVCYKMGCVVR